MKIRSGRGRFRWLAGMLAPVAILAPAQAFAIFPPVVQQPTVSITGVKSSPPVHIQGGQVPPPVATKPAVSTPEPATFITGAVTLALAGLLLKKKKAIHVSA